jgi:hypothetical protein
MAVSLYSRYYKLPPVEVAGKTSLSQRLTGAPELLPGSIMHTLVGTETLDQLSAKYYGREDLWWRIADANPNKFPLDWQAGDTLVIPPIQAATRMPRR